MPSPVRPSPSQLHRYLIHAREDLGVENALQYESPLKRARYGPDILTRIPDTSLTDLGIPHGDIVCLNDGSNTWYHSPAVKQAMCNTGSAYSTNSDVIR